MKIDLCKLFGVEEGEEFTIETKVTWFNDSKYKIENNILKVASIKYSNFSPSDFNLNDFIYIEKIIKLPKKKQFSQDTLNFFKCIDKRCKYIAKDKNGAICVYDSRPIKNEKWWDNDEWFYRLAAIKDSLFDEILWEDEEPIYIDNYVER